MPVCRQFAQHSFRNVCKDCRQPREDHRFNKETFRAIRQALDLDAEPQHSNHPEYTWVPRHCPSMRIEEYFKNFPDSQVPRRGSEGAKQREREFVIQFPLQDIDVNQCRFLENEAIVEHHRFIEARDTKAVDEAQVMALLGDRPMECARCQNLITPGELMVSSAKADEDYAWHPACFVCHDCKKMPVDLIHCIGSYGKVFCLRHYGEHFMSRCHGCDELIFQCEFLKAMGRSWHPEHFRCIACDGLLMKKTFIRKNDQPYCVNCYESMYRHSCKKCTQRITVQHAEVAIHGDYYHEDCLMCEKCSVSLLKGELAQHDGRIYCVSCYTDNYAPVCRGCKTPLEPYKRHVDLLDGSWHNRCFVCHDCRCPLDKKRYVPRKEGNYCIPCYRENFSMKCHKCKKPIISKGVTFCNQPYHATCVICSNCDQQLRENLKVFVKEEKLYCEECHTKLFCKICERCSSPIYNHMKYAARGEKSWHIDCFICTHCKKSLIGEHIIESKAGIACATCSQKRLEERIGR